MKSKIEREEGTQEMDYVKLGHSGLDVSRICLGCMSFGAAEKWVLQWVLDEENSRPIIKKALELGINFFDTANVYSMGASEEILGRALKDYANRDEIVLATKVHQRMHEGPNGAGLSRKAIMSEIDKSLKRLGTDYVDLEMLPLCREEKIGVTPYSPLASGRLTRDWSETTHRSKTDQIQKSKYDATAEADRLVVDRLAAIAENHGVPRSYIAIAWLLQKEPVIAPIIGATKMSHLEDAVRALSVKLTSEEMAFLEEPYVPHPIVGHH